MEAIRTAGRTARAIVFLVSMGAFLWIFGSMAIPSWLNFMEARNRVGLQDTVVQQIEMDRVAYTLCESYWAKGSTPHYEKCAQYEGVFPGSKDYSEAAWDQYRGEAFQWVCAKKQENADPWCAEFAKLIPEWPSFDKSARAAWEEQNWRYMCAPLAHLRVMKHNPWKKDFRQRTSHLRWCDRYTSDLDGFADLDIKRADFLYTRLAEIDRNEASWF